MYIDNHTALVSPADEPNSLASGLGSILARDAGDLAAARSDIDDFLGQQDDQGQPQLISSVLPLRTNDGSGVAPVDLSLDQRGETYVPDNPLVDVKLPDDLASPVTFGDEGISLDLGSSSSSADRVADDNLFYADAAPATDVVLAPISTGLETYYQLRAPESPDHFRIGVNLPDGTQLTSSADGGASIIRNGDPIAVVYPPAAIDAAGTPVDVTMSVDENDLVLHVPHSDPGVRYPISVDPVVDLYTWSTDGAGRFADWVANKTTGSPYQLRRTCVDGVNCQGGLAPTGLYVEVPANSAIADNAQGAWQYQVPHYPWTTSYISTLNLGPLNFVPRTDTAANPFMFAGIYSDNPSSYLDTEAQNTAASNLYWSLNPGTATSGKTAVFSQWSWVARTVSAWRDAYLGGAAVWLGDTENPEITQVTHSGISIGAADWSVSNWVDNVTPSVTVTARDNGLGIKQFYVPDTDGSLRTVSENCDGTKSSPCPQTPASVTATYDTSEMPSGVTITAVEPEDALGKVTPRTFVLRVDHDPPEIADPTGSLTQTAGSGPYTLHVDATDGDATDTSGEDWQSGVKAIKVFVNGQQVAATPNQSCTTQEASCPLSLDYTLNAADFSTNQLHVKVSATDQLGHEQTREWDTTITGANTQPKINLSGALFNAPQGWVTQLQSYDVPASAQDAAGVTELRLLIDGQQVGQASQTCPNGGCALNRTFSVNPQTYDGGSHTIELRATDSAGSTASETWTMNVDPSGTIATGEATDTVDAAASTAIEAQPTSAEEQAEGIDPAVEVSGSTVTSTGTDVKSQFSTDIEDGYSVDSTTGSIGIDPVGVDNAATSAHVVNDAAAVYADVRNQVDTAVQPLVNGLAATEQIRSATSPQNYSWQLSLRPGQTLSQPDNQDVVVNNADGTAALTIGVDDAEDAAGHAIPTTLTKSGTTVTMSVAHQAPGTAYPVIASPSFQAAYSYTVPADSSQCPAGYPAAACPGPTQVDVGAPKPTAVKEKGKRWYLVWFGAKQCAPAPGECDDWKAKMTGEYGVYGRAHKKRQLRAKHGKKVGSHVDCSKFDTGPYQVKTVSCRFHGPNPAYYYRHEHLTAKDRYKVYVTYPPGVVTIPYGHCFKINLWGNGHVGKPRGCDY